MYANNEKELLEKLTRLEDRFEKEMDEVDSRKTNQMTKLKEEFEKKMADVQDKIVHLEQENEKLTGDFSAAKERIASLEGEVERLSDLLLLSPSATSINRRHPVRSAAGGAAASNDNGQPTTGKIESPGDDYGWWLFYSLSPCISI